MPICDGCAFNAWSGEFSFCNIEETDNPDKREDPCPYYITPEMVKSGVPVLLSCGCWRDKDYKQTSLLAHDLSDFNWHGGCTHRGIIFMDDEDDREELLTAFTQGFRPELTASIANKTPQENL